MLYKETAGERCDSSRGPFPVDCLSTRSHPFIFTIPRQLIIPSSLSYTYQFSNYRLYIQLPMEPSSSKRRRTDAAAALSKPFKSPLRTRQPKNINDILPTPTVFMSPKKTQTPAIPTKPVSKLAVDLPNPDTTPTPLKRKRMLSFPVPIERPDIEILELQKQQRALRLQVEALRANLETATQALKLESSTKDIELQALITKWRLVSQDAADEVFVGAKERVARMGGLAAWKERSRHDAARWDFDEERHERDHVDENEAQMDGSYVDDSLKELPTGKNCAEQGVESQDEVGATEFT